MNRNVPSWSTGLLITNLKKVNISSVEIRCWNGSPGPMLLLLLLNAITLYKVMLDIGRDPVQYCNISSMLQADSFALSEGRTGAVPDYRSKLSGIDGVHV
jgi:hypothetical protein